MLENSTLYTAALVPDGYSPHEEKTESVKYYEALKVGSFFHPMMPDEELNVTVELIDQIILNHQRALTSGNEVAVDCDHVMPYSGGPAYGWIKDLVRDGDKLLAGIEWNHRGASAIEEKDYRYLSSEFHFDWKDIETKESVGAKLTGLSLVNRPHIPGLKAVELSLKTAKEKIEEPQNAASLKNDNNGDEMSEQVKLADQIVELSAKLENKNKDVLDASKKADESAVLLKQRDEEIAKLNAQISGMAEKMSALEAASKELMIERVKADVQKKIDEGNAFAHQREVLVELAMTNREAFEKMTSQKVVMLGSIGVEQNSDEEGVGGEQDFVSLSIALSKEKNITVGQAAMEIQKSHPAVAAKYFKKGKN